MWNRAAVFMCAGASQRGLGSEPMLMVRLSSMLGTMTGMDVEWEPLAENRRVAPHARHSAKAAHVALSWGEPGASIRWRWEW